MFDNQSLPSPAPPGWDFFYVKNHATMPFRCGYIPSVQPEFDCEREGVTYEKILIFKKADRDKMPPGTVIINLYYTGLDVDTHRGELEFEVEETGQRGVVPITAPQWFKLKHIEEPVKDWIGVII